MKADLSGNPLPNKEIDLDLLVFIERYATSLIKWDLLTHFGRHPDEQFSLPELARQLGRNYKSVRVEVGDLAILGVFHYFTENNEPYYQLTTNPHVRLQIFKFTQTQPLYFPQTKTPHLHTT